MTRYQVSFGPGRRRGRAEAASWATEPEAVDADSKQGDPKQGSLGWSGEGDLGMDSPWAIGEPDSALEGQDRIVALSVDGDALRPAAAWQAGGDGKTPPPVCSGRPSVGELWRIVPALDPRLHQHAERRRARRKRRRPPPFAVAAALVIAAGIGAVAVAAASVRSHAAHSVSGAALRQSLDGASRTSTQTWMKLYEGGWPGSQGTAGRVAAPASLLSAPGPPPIVGIHEDIFMETAQ